MVSIKALLAADGVDSGLASRIRDADRDGSGCLSVNELVKVFQSEQAAQSEKAHAALVSPEAAAGPTCPSQSAA
jgi:hypothetical protein